MASEKKVFPILSNRAWWELRRAFTRSLPGEANSRYVATVLDMSERAAANVIPNLRRLGLIDDAGIPTEHAVLWRDDAHYAEVCAAILGEVYPKQLTDALPPPDPDRDRVASWFARETRTGQAASSQMARLYVLLAQADPRGAEEKAPEPASTPAVTRVQAGGRRPDALGQQGSSGKSAAPSRVTHAESPRIVVNLNITLQPGWDATGIDQLFASLARHLGVVESGD